MTWRPALWLVAAAVLAIDLATKQWALWVLEPGEKHPFIGEYVQWQLVFNSGAAFSFMSQYTWILTVVVMIVIGLLIGFARRAQSTAAMLIFGIGIGGAIGNLLDRLFRAPGFAEGHVVDMINYADQFVGNVADIAIVGAATVAVVRGLLGKPLLSSGESTPPESSSPVAQPATPLL